MRIEKRITKEVVYVYTSSDGQKFSSKELCLAHEAEIAKEEKRQKLLSDMGIVDVSDNEFLQEMYIKNDEYHFVAFKFIHNVNYSVAEYFKALGYVNLLKDLAHEKGFYTLVEGTKKPFVMKKVMVEDICPLEQGKEYLYIAYTDLTPLEYLPETMYECHKLSDFKAHFMSQLDSI
jgi:hypothetical protein